MTSSTFFNLIRMKMKLLKKLKLISQKNNSHVWQRKPKLNELETYKQTTHSLQTALELLNTNIHASKEANVVLESSTKTLGSTQHELNRLQDFVQVSRRIVQQLQRKDVQERVLLASGFLIFLFTFFYVIYKRLF